MRRLHPRWTVVPATLLAVLISLSLPPAAAQNRSAAAPAAAAPTRTHQITVDDYLTVNHITDVATAPDGRHVVYAELRWGERDEPRQTDLWLAATAGGAPVRLTFDRANDSGPQWAGNDRIFFLSKRKREENKPPYDNSTQVWALGLAPGEPLPITRVKGGVQAFQVTGDARYVYYAKEGDEAEQEWQELRKKYSSIEFGTGPVKYTQIWRLDLQTWREEQVYAPQRHINEFRVSPDNTRLALITSPDERQITREGQSRLDIYDLQTKKLATPADELYRAKAPSPHGWLENLAWAADGNAVACTVGFDGYPTQILVADLLESQPVLRQLPRPEGVDVEGHLHWRPRSGDLCFVGQWRARQRVYCLTQAADGAPSYTTLTDGDVVVFTYSFDQDGQQFAYVRSDTQNMGDLYWGRFGQPDAAAQRLTEVNPQVATWKLPQVSLFEWQAPDGVKVEGILELPPDYRPGSGPLPTVIELHGGPTSATLLNLRYWIYGRTLFAANGYALLSPNYRGSTGYGDKFMTDLIGREADIEVQDILAGVDALIERGIADPERLGVMGWSNGGFLTNALITATRRFKAASSGAGVLDQFMQWGLEDTPGHVINYMRGLPWEQTEAYLKASPAYRLGQVTTPTIVHVGEADERVPAAHARALYRALKEYNRVDTVLLVYPKAGHGLTISDHRKGKLDWDFAWFNKYLKSDTPAVPAGALQPAATGDVPGEEK